MDFGEVAADPRADLDIFLGCELPGEFVPLDELALDGLADCHRRRRGGRVSCAAVYRIPRSDKEDEGRQWQRAPCRMSCHRALPSRSERTRFFAREAH